MRPLFLTVAALEAKALELRRASLALTLLYLASKSLKAPSSNGDCFIPFDIMQSFFCLVTLLEVKQTFQSSVKEIDNVQLGIVNIPSCCMKLFQRPSSVSVPLPKLKDSVIDSYALIGYSCYLSGDEPCVHGQFPRTMLELLDLSNNFELKVWSFVDVECNDYLSAFPIPMVTFQDISSSDQYDIDVHLLKYIFVSTSHQQFSLALPH
ncbi:hypothetical protein Tco_0454247 [Tanacetum coccineum]